jgi:RNA polymerase sigma-70 factor (ECF subfamily)
MHSSDAHERIDAIYRSDSRRVLATLIRLLGDFDLAEEAVHDAFASAVERWPVEGVPANPVAWLVSTGRFKSIDQLRRRAKFDSTLAPLLQHLGDASTPPADIGSEDVEDDRLRLIFTC